MTTPVRIGSAAVGDIDLKTRLRIAANLRLLKWKFQFPTDAAFAKSIGVSRGAMNRYLKGERTVGLDVLLKIHRSLHESIDWMVGHEPEARWYDPDSAADPPKPSRRRHSG